MNLTYLASCYSVGNADAELRHKRYIVACKAAAILMKRGLNIFCPIAHSHVIEVEGMPGFIGDHDFWLRQDFAILRHASDVLVLTMPHWQESTGIGRELKLARGIGIPIDYIDPRSLGIDCEGL